MLKKIAALPIILAHKICCRIMEATHFIRQWIQISWRNIKFVWKGWDISNTFYAILHTFTSVLLAFKEAAHLLKRWIADRFAKLRIALQCNPDKNLVTWAYSQF